MSSKKKSAFKQVLENHHRDGKLYRAFPHENLKPLSYLDTIVPELLLVHLLNTEYGASASEEILSELAESLENEQWIGAASVLAKKVLSNKTAHITRLKRCSSFKYFENAIGPLVAYYPNFPLAFLAPSQSPDSVWLKKFKVGLHSLYDKRGDAGSAMLGCFVLIALNHGYFMPGDILSPNSIRKLTVPGTREQGASVRAALGATVGGLFACFREEEGISLWSESFWQRGFEIEPVDWSVLVDEF